TLEAHLALPERERLPGGDSQLPLDRIEPGHGLGHGVLDLQPRVHLHEVELAAIEQELDGARTHVADLARDHERRGAQPLAQRLGEPRRRRLLDELLMAALRRAVALAQVYEIAAAVGEHLHPDLTQRGPITLQEAHHAADRNL